MRVDLGTMPRPGGEACKLGIRYESLRTVDAAPNLDCVWAARSGGCVCQAHLQG